jgi:hypothetical protein
VDLVLLWQVLRKQQGVFIVNKRVSGRAGREADMHGEDDKNKRFHDPERFNKVIKEVESVKERGSILIEPDLVGRVVIVVIFLIIYFTVYR